MYVDEWCVFFLGICEWCPGGMCVCLGICMDDVMCFEGVHAFRI